jgi:hypothetical protein
MAVKAETEVARREAAVKSFMLIWLFYCLDN